MRAKATSLVYRKIMNNSPDPLGTLGKTWAVEQGALDNDDWIEGIESPREVAIKARFHLLQLLILHRSYTSRTLLNRMGRSDTDQCIRGCGEVGTFFHIIWSCPRIKQYWREIIGVMSEVIDQEVTLGAKWHILCVTGEDN